jgi:iron complex transport system substrate-binding protein
VFPRQRIVCLTEETVETLYLIGARDHIVGVTGYAVRPPEVRREKTRVGAFTSADIDKIVSLAPDLVLTFSDLQADIAADLIQRGLAVHAFNQRTIAEILDMIRTIGALVDARAKAEQLVATLSTRLEEARHAGQSLRRQPRVYFEEWDDPPICGINWVSELIGIAGGIDIFAEQAASRDAKGRIVSHENIIAGAPDLIIGSWCGKKFRPERLAARPGFAAIPAVRDAALFEIKSPLILQPGPAALTDGLDALQKIVSSRFA